MRFAIVTPFIDNPPIGGLSGQRSLWGTSPDWSIAVEETMNAKRKAEHGPRSWKEARELAHASAAAMTEEEDAALRSAAHADPDNPPTDGLTFRRAR